MKDLPDEITKNKGEVEKVFKQLPDIVGGAAMEQTRQAFRTESWQGSKWKPRKINKGPRRALLVKSGRGKRSIDYEVRPGEVAQGTDVIYMKYHNLGEGNNPERQLMGQSDNMDDEVDRWMDDQMDRIFT